ncbi:tetraacyldisaccharide 4'-kinase [Gluconacetobacter entanii]|uniref:Tetraacyldisaccharide 4'-kinase n=1 Tax=Gluconacetobacter entanii TaxID=108528 RepID=A0A318PTB4_9PROT|nr:tetraacyldisaccharide 4'-kinase [Gluconacetobacter entanii]MCE2577406.1 tetraacyldisaccharide 4'-kinase [Komagataeibacter sp. FNDCR1]PYD63469.1 tetraacyldisaccharide 4'-kinase [Gluconacetobacter entanii]
MHAPHFWEWQGGSRSLPALLLSPFSWLYAAIGRMRLRRYPWAAPVPVLCCGNLTVGGTGKTTVALDLGRRLVARNRRVAFLTRGYGGNLRQVARVQAGRHTARDVGDEALLLAALAPCYVGADRAQAARLAIADGADCLIMDDGLQNPGLRRDVSLVVVDGYQGFGNGCVLPAGPLREPVSSGLSRAQAILMIGEDRTGLLHGLPPALPCHCATLQQDEAALPLHCPVVAFAGIGRPSKFFDGLRQSDVDVRQAVAFADHHPYHPAELAQLLKTAHDMKARLVTTPKDFVRLPPDFQARVTPVGVSLRWSDPQVPERLLETWLGKSGQ